MTHDFAKNVSPSEATIQSANENKITLYNRITKEKTKKWRGKAVNIHDYQKLPSVHAVVIKCKI